MPKVIGDPVLRCRETWKGLEWRVGIVVAEVLAIEVCAARRGPC